MERFDLTDTQAEAILELKETDFKNLFAEDINKKKEFVRDVEIETDIEMMIPDNYITNIQERLSIYTELNNLKNEAEITAFKGKLLDRFGKMPNPVLEIFNGLRLRWLCKELGFERIILKNRKLRCYFISNPQSFFYQSNVFQNMLSYVGKKADRKLTFKRSNKYFILVKDDCKGIRHAELLLTEIRDAIT